MSRKCPERFPEKSRKCPGSFREKLTIFPRNLAVRFVFRRFPASSGDEISRRIRISGPGTSKTTKTRTTRTTRTTGTTRTTTTLYSPFFGTNLPGQAPGLSLENHSALPAEAVTDGCAPVRGGGSQRWHLHTAV